MFGLMTGVGGHSTDRFSDWLAAMLKSTLATREVAVPNWLGSDRSNDR